MTNLLPLFWKMGLSRTDISRISTCLLYIYFTYHFIYAVLPISIYLFRSNQFVIFTHPTTLLFTTSQKNTKRELAHSFALFPSLSLSIFRFHPAVDLELDLPAGVHVS